MSSLNMWRNRLAKASIKSGIFTPEAANWKTCARNLSTRRACFDYNSLIRGDTFSIAVCEVKLYSPTKVCRGSISVWLRNIRSRHGIGSRSCRPMCSSFSTSSYKAMSSLYEEDATAIVSDVCMDEDDESDFSCQPRVPYGVINLALDAVVKVFTVNSTPNYFLPWQNKPQREVTGSGFIVPGQRILTNAHVVADQTYVLLRKHGVPTKFRAKVEAVGHECDLALLSVEDEKFWDGMHMLELGDIPNLQESVAVVGYPQGGDNISVTRGVVSRVEPVQYVHGASHLMAIQIDAAINPGNSGGPALMEDKVVGVVFQNLSGAENIGYIIPVPVISHFLADVEDNGQYIGFCALGLTCQATENSQLREHFKLPKDTTGVLVNKVHPLTDTSRYIQKDDMLLSFDGIPIANDGSVHFRNRERISFHHFVSMKKAGETALVQVLRCGQELEFHVKLGPLRLLVPIHQFDKLPSYYIFAGLVFVPLTLPYLHEYGDDWFNIAPRKLCDRAFSETPKKPGEQLVILSQVLVDDINSGYERLAELQVKSINGIEILNLHQLKEVVEGCKEEDIRFDLDDNRVVVLNYEAAKEASRHILERHRIAFPMSQDLILDPPENELAPWEIPDVVNDKTKSMASMAL